MLDLYWVNIDDLETGMSAVSLVEHPAIDVNFLKFEKQDTLKFKADSDQQILYGPAVLADTPIYRREGSYEYYIAFTKDVIKKIAERYLKNGFQNQVNLQHNEDSFVNGVNMTQIFIKDTEKGVCPKGFEDVTEGSLFIEYHVEDKELWEKLKSDEYQGFSIEILCDLEMEFARVKKDESVDDEFEKEIEDLLK